MINPFGLFPVPLPLKPQSLVYDLKTRLDWGEPALTIVDVRNRTLFAISHIAGAISIPLDNLVEQVRHCLDFSRDIYVYGETDEETAEAAMQLRRAGYGNVSEIRGGLAAWKAVDYPVESVLSGMVRAK